MTKIAHYPLVEDIHLIERKGPWRTKSGGGLNVMFSLPLENVYNDYFRYHKTDLSSVSRDIRGLRLYLVNKIPAGHVGANEWHKLRNELVFCMSGSVEWTCEDILRDQKTITLDEHIGIWVPPYILHTYRANSTNVALLVVSNTLFVPDDPDTHDTYTYESFREIQEKHHR